MDPASSGQLPPPQGLYKLGYWVFGWFYRTFFRLMVTGREHLPPGGFIVAANHASFLDPPLVGSSVPLPRQVCFMAKSELFKIPLLGPIISRVGSFPVIRGTPDRKAIRHALELLQAGGVLGVFPEGTRSKNGELQQPEPGIALIALKSGAPVVPAALVGTHGWLKRKGWRISINRFQVRFGPPLSLGEGRQRGKEELEACGLRIMEAIRALKDAS